jgi:hypothetical protein
MEPVMKRIGTVGLIAIPIVILGGTALAEGTGEQQPGAVIQSVGPAVASNPQVQPLDLNDQQRQDVKKAVAGEDIEVTFQLKDTKSAETFEPTVGAKVPAALKLHPLPRPLIYSIPVLKQYTYIKLKHAVVIVDPMTRKIADVFPGT